MGMNKNWYFKIAAKWPKEFIYSKLSGIFSTKSTREESHFISDTRVTMVFDFDWRYVDNWMLEHSLTKS